MPYSIGSEGYYSPRHEALEHPGYDQDDTASPKVIDFGIAKAVNEELAPYVMRHCPRADRRHAAVHEPGTGGAGAHTSIAQ